MAAREFVMTGGCQCGAVRYGLRSEPRVSLCFCRMCQKAGGNYFGAFARVQESEIEWTRGSRAIFASSEAAERGFCEKCGTPLTFQYPGRGRISVSAGSLDDPSRFPPEVVHGIEGKADWFDTVCRLQGTRTEDGVPAEALSRLASHQHPDRDS